MGNFWKAVANPSTILDQWGVGPESGFDFITGRGAARDAREQAEKDRELQLKLRSDEIALQKEFAQHGIQWRVEDAKAAGLHPLAALGASGASYSPTTTMLDPLPSEKQWQHNLGQSVRSYVMGRLDPFNRLMQARQLERAGLENDLLRLQYKNELMNTGNPSSKAPPDYYLTGQADAAKGDPGVIDVPLRRVVSDPRDPSKEAGAIQDWQIVRTQKGYAVVPAQGVKQAIEDSPMEYQWLVRAARRTYTLPNGRLARMNPVTGELKEINRGTFFNEVWDKFLGGPFGVLRAD